MAKSMTLEEVKEAKKQLELKLVKMFQAFEKDTELKLGYVDIMRKRSKKESKKVDYSNPVCGPIYKGPVADVNINVDLDLVY